MKDIVIPYLETYHKELELSFALRSIEKYLTGYAQIFIVGDKPRLQNIIHIPFTERCEKEQNIFRKIKTACQDERVSDDFIMWHDDHFLLKPLDKIKYWYDGSLKELSVKARGGYRTAVLNTLEKFPDGFNYDVHAPVVFNKKTFLELTNWTKEHILKSYYCNYTNVNDAEPFKDCKINFPISKTAIEQKIDGRLFFSTGPQAMTGEMVDVFEQLYPLKSKYEL